MPTDTSNPRVARAAVQLHLTGAGWAVVAMMLAAVFLSSSARLAVGFLVPLAAAIAIDLYLSWYIISRRQVTITPARTVAYTTSALPLRITVDGPAHPVRVRVLSPVSGPHMIGVTDQSETIELPSPISYTTNFLRCNIGCTVFGLSTAHRWETHPIAQLHWAPAPGTERLATPNAVDEFARLRTYVPGDRMSRVSWPVTARTGQMHVRAAGDGLEEFTVVLNLGSDDGTGAATIDAERVGVAASQLEHQRLTETLQLAATLTAQLLEDGHQVRLITTELADIEYEHLRSQALANPRVPVNFQRGATPQGQIVDRHVTDDEDAARRLARAEVAADVSWSYGPYVEVSRLGVRSLP